MRSIHVAVWFATVGIVLLPRLAWSDTVGLLNEFNAGETARASEVNDNFDAVESAVDGNDALIAALEARIVELENRAGIPGPQGPQGETGADGSAGVVLHVFDADGNDIGLYAGTVEESSAHGLGDRQVLVYLEEYEAIAHFDLIDGTIRPFFHALYYFESTNCTGLAYTERAGTVIRLDGGDNLYFVTDSASETIIPQSSTERPFQSESNCRTEGPFPRTLAAVTVIDPVPDLPGPLYVAPARAPPM